MSVRPVARLCHAAERKLHSSKAPAPRPPGQLVPHAKGFVSACIRNKRRLRIRRVKDDIATLSSSAGPTNLQIQSLSTSETQGAPSDPGAPVGKLLGENKMLSSLKNQFAWRETFDDEIHSFDPLFLRDCCRCPQCRDPFSGQKKFETCDIPKDIRAHPVKRDADSVTFKWHPDLPGYSADHQTTIGIAYLSRLVNTKPHPILEPVTTWTKKDSSLLLSPIDYKQFMTDTRSTLQVLRRLKLYGLAILNDVGVHEQGVEDVAGRIGSLRDSFYGRTWDVKDKPRAENVAYTSVHLGLHMDLLPFKDPPGFQLLHCIEPSPKGGTSLFSDSYQAARLIADTSPRAFETLALFPVAYAYSKGGHLYADQKPVFELSPHIHPSAQVPLFNRISAVNWSPPFQGDLRYNTGLDDDWHSFREWLDAATVFKDLVNSPHNLVEYRLERGQCVIFNNRRVLHGRTAFSSPSAASASAASAAVAADGTEAKPRWLKGAYIDTDVFESACVRFANEAKTRFVEEQRHRGRDRGWTSKDQDSIFRDLVKRQELLHINPEEGLPAFNQIGSKDFASSVFGKVDGV